MPVPGYRARRTPTPARTPQHWTTARTAALSRRRVIPCTVRAVTGANCCAQPQKACPIGRSTPEVTVTPGQPDTSAHLRTGGPTRRARRPSQQQICYAAEARRSCSWHASWTAAASSSACRPHPFHSSSTRYSPPSGKSITLSEQPDATTIWLACCVTRRGPARPSAAGRRGPHAGHRRAARPGTSGRLHRGHQRSSTRPTGAPAQRAAGRASPAKRPGQERAPQAVLRAANHAVHASWPPHGLDAQPLSALDAGWARYCGEWLLPPGRTSGRRSNGSSKLRQRRGLYLAGTISSGTVRTGDHLILFDGKTVVRVVHFSLIEHASYPVPVVGRVIAHEDRPPVTEVLPEPGRRTLSNFLISRGRTQPGPAQVKLVEACRRGLAATGDPAFAAAAETAAGLR
jgi:hypothetical protein